MKDKYVGMPFYAVYGDDLVEPITKEHGIIKEGKDGYYLAENDNGIEFTVFIDETFNNLDFTADIGTDYRTFTDENDANSYVEYLKSLLFERENNNV